MSRRTLLIDRPPRIQPRLPVETIEIPAPPQPGPSALAQLLQMGLPIVTMLAFVFMMVFSGGRSSPWMVLPMILMVLSSGGIAVYSYVKERRDRAAAEAAYRERLVEMNRDMRNYHDQQRRFYVYNYPEQPVLARIVRDSRWELDKNEHALRGNSRLWERRTTDDDFGVVRLGMGTIPSTVTYVLKSTELHDDPLTRAALKLQEDSRFVDDIPVVISLRPVHQKQSPASQEKPQEDEEKARAERWRHTPTVHALGIAGERSAVYEHVRGLLAHYVVFHAPSDARLYILAAHRAEWQWAEQLPHCRSDENVEQLCFLDAIAAPEEADDRIGIMEEEKPLPRFLESIRKLLAQRKLQLQATNDEGGARGDPTLPQLLVVIDLLDMPDEAALVFNGLEGDAAISILLAEGAALGAAVMFLVEKRTKVPSACQAVVEVERTTPATNSRLARLERLHFRYAETGVNTYRYIGQADAIASTTEMTNLAARLAELDVRQSYGGGLPVTVPFMEFMGYRSLEELETDARLRWQMSTQPEHADWLCARIGMMGGNKPRTLHFSAKRDGVHGIIAGSTGSGKSELLISLITGMAVHYDPTVLNFVLVDYKGGGAFQAFKDLPHCVDIITNLSREGVNRMFTAINAELQRRQKLNTDTNTKNIVEYRKQGLHLTYAPYPFLFIIIDEFAEMIADRAEYRAQLETITRVGRAQGVSLILAAQRPTGVTDQMRSNIKFRICLRVESAGESRELLRRGDAAFLPSGIPGRGYLQVGNEEVDLIQFVYAGDKYVDPTQKPQAEVIWPDRGGTYDPARDQEPPELYRAIVASLSKLAATQGIPKQHAPWPDFLPRKLALTTPLVSQDPAVSAITSERYLDPVSLDLILLGEPREPTESLNSSVVKWLNDGFGWIQHLDWERQALKPVVGLIDHPYVAQQLPLVIDFSKGHVAVFGASGWGKTTFVRSLVVSLCATHSPDCAHVYLLDLGGRNLAALADLPHVGAVINPDEEGYKERVEQLFRELDDVVDKRKIILANEGVDSIYRYNVLHPGDPLPGIVVAIDNFVEFKETFGGEKENTETLLDRFVALTRESKPYGVHFLLTVNQPSVLSTQLYNIFTERFVLKLGDPSDYRVILGTSVQEIGDIPGRGYVSCDRVPLSFQVAVPTELPRTSGEGATDENKDLRHLADSMRQYMERSGRNFKKPFTVGALPKSVLLRQLLAREHGLVLDETFLPKLKEITRRKWAESIQAEKADWLQVTFGLVSGNRPRIMHLEAKRDGVHGLIAGGTGSGKSELLMSVVVDLALRYDPSVLNFVLIDYKGGGAFAPFEKLPHCVDIVTNLNRAAVQRMFTAIRAEIERRQKLTTETSTKDIVEYRRRGYHLTHEPLPHFFIIIDEYAEMIAESPEFKAELDSITRVGRSAGIHLLLASQRPTGITDQMRANIKYRICLRVEEPETSREMLRRSDAAFLPGGIPGRGYLQIGNENIELFQTAYTGDVYEYANLLEGERTPRFYDVVVNLANELLVESQGTRPFPPWPRPLPRAISLATPLSERYFASDLLGVHWREQKRPLLLNPHVADWFEDHGSWPGVDWLRQAMRAVIGLVDDPYGARQLPLIVNFNKGHAVMFGASGWGKTTFLRSLILTLACTHSPDEFHAYILDLGGHNLEVLRCLPHVGTVIMPDEPGYQERVQQLLRELNEIIDERKRRFARAGVSTLAEYNAASVQKPEPAILVAIDNFGEYIETFSGDDKVAGPNNLLDTLVTLMGQSKAFGVHFAVTADRPNVLSGKLYSLFTERYTLRLAEADDYATVVGGRVAEVEEIPGRGVTRVDRHPLVFQVALSVGTPVIPAQPRAETEAIRTIGAHMIAFIKSAPHEYREPLHIDALPKSSSYRQLVAQQFGLQAGRPFMAELKTAMEQAWAENRTPERADWLKVTLGIKSGLEPRILHLEAKRDGVHGILAGGTGSGKSEALMTMIVGLALNYPPDILNFVLVDYKGGGAFKPFEQLPHCVDIVTNLNKAAVNRVFTAINAEIRRRQKLNADTGTKDIIAYRQKGLHLTREPYPHLFIIIDEYAEMIDDYEEYKAELESITRVGRSQGINLILASQRPKGVTDQMRANIKLKLCLRVEQTDTSVELLRRPDAAFLPGDIPGRGYLQVGNEPLELLQVSYTGESQPDDRLVPVLWPDRPQTSTISTTEDVPKFYNSVVKLASELTGGKMARQPWPPFLPKQISLQTQLFNTQTDKYYELNSAVTDWLNGETINLWCGVNWEETALRPTVGLVDDPAEARQFPLRFDLSREHLAVFGDSGWGKTSLLRTIMVDLAATHSPDELHIYVIDLGGRNYRSLEALPHLGGVIYADEETFDERVQRLMDKLATWADQRSQVLASVGASNLYEYNQRFPERALPAILVIIDNFAPLQENYEMFVEAAITPLVRRSLATGINFVVSANTPNNLPGRLLALFGQQITFKQSNPDRYLDIVGRGAIEIDDIPGRGYVRLERRPLLFQAALPVGALISGDGKDPLPEADELQRLATNMAHLATRTRHRPERIEILPEIVSLQAMLDRAPAVRPNRIEAVLGQSVDLQPAVFDLKRTGLHFQVIGPPVSGKTTVLYNFVLSLAYRYTPEQVIMILVDPQCRFAEYGGQHSLNELPHIVATVNEVPELAALLSLLRAEGELLATRASTREVFILIDNFDDISEEIDRHQNLAQELGNLARRYGREGLHFVLAGSMESGPNEFKRAVQATNFGVGLRTPGSLDALRVMRLPAGFRSGKDLVIGRGYVVKSGQPTMIQIASPYDGVTILGAEEEDRIPSALDYWVEHILSLHPGPKASWSVQAERKTPEIAKATQGTQPEANPRIKQMLRLLRRAMLWDVQNCSESPGAEPLLPGLLAQYEPEAWADEKVLRHVLKAVHRAINSGLDDELYTTIYGDQIDDDNLIIGLENGLPELNGIPTTNSDDKEV